MSQRSLFLAILLASIFAAAFGQSSDEAQFRTFFHRLQTPLSGDVIEGVRRGAGLTKGEMEAVLSSAHRTNGELDLAGQRRMIAIHLDRLKIDLGPVRFQVLRDYVIRTEPQ